MSKPIAPSELIADAPYYCLEVNSKWAGIIVGLLEPALEYEFWGGDAEDQENGVFGIHEMIEMLETFC